jgi:hypothetical protein
MGGFGSGKWSNILTRRAAVEQCRVLSIKQLRLGGLFGVAGCLTVDWRDVTGLVVASAVVRLDGDGVIVECGDMEYKVGIERMACLFGGVRYWFLCPAVKDDVYCGNRVTKLFLLRGVLCLGVGRIMILLIAHARRAINMIRCLGILRVLILVRFRLLRLCGWVDCKSLKCLG